MRLEYIRSTGTQYIDTGFIPSSENVRVILDFVPVAVKRNYGIFGSGDGATASFDLYWQSASAHIIMIGDHSETTTMIRRNVHVILDMTADNGTWSYTATTETAAETKTGTYTSFDHSNSLYIFADNVDGEAKCTSTLLFSCQIYQDGALVRDFIPYSSGDEIGLYDTVNGVFYQNAGTGSFIDGPKVFELVTDRTARDVARRTWRGFYNASDLNRVEDASAYLADRLHDVPDELKTYAEGLGVAWDAFFDVPYAQDGFSITTKTDWSMTDFPTQSQMTRYLGNVKLLITALEAVYPALPESMDRLDWRGANAIERALTVLYEALVDEQARVTDLLDRTPPAFIYSGEVFAGEV